MKHFVCAIATVTVAGTASAETMTTGWIDVRADQPGCIRIAREAIKTVGYGDVSAGKESVFGWSGRYGIAVRCVGERGIAAYFIYGPNLDTNERLGTQLRSSITAQDSAGRK